MKTLVAIALAAASAVAASAKSVTVCFDDALTNGTEWAYSSLKWTSTHGAYGLTSKDSQVVSPTFNFSITSLVVVAKATSVNADSRRLAVTPLFDGAPSGDAALVRDISPTVAYTQETVSVSWDASAGVHYQSGPLLSP